MQSADPHNRQVSVFVTVKYLHSYKETSEYELLDMFCLAFFAIVQLETIVPGEVPLLVTHRPPGQQSLRSLGILQ